jgi:hypothetical protein
MVSTGSKASEWYCAKPGASAGQQAGPFSWEQVRSLAQAGTLEPADLVWNPQLSQWQLAAQIPDLFPAVASPGVPGTYPGPPPSGRSATTRGRSWLPWLAPLLTALIIVGGGLGAYFGFLRDSGESTSSHQTTTTLAATTTSVAMTTTSEAATTTIPVTTAQSTATTVTETTAVSEPPALNLDNGDNGREVVLHVGERMRIDLTPKAVDRVQSVKWNYEPIVVQEKDSGADKANDAVVGAWLEVEAVVAGPATVRAAYEYPGGTVKTVWVVYVTVTD